jgi:mRNA interferase MazF
MPVTRGEVWQVSFDPSVEAEIRKTRPAVIISSDAVGVLPLRVVVPFTSWQTDFSAALWMVRVEPSTTNGLAKASAADAFQVKSVSTRRLLKKLGTVSDPELRAIVEAVGTVIEHR